MAEQKTIPVVDLVLDTRNPRLEEGLSSQREALESMLRHLGKKVNALAQDIVDNGLNPTERFIVLADEENPDRYVVLEGNRRLTALRILESPVIADGFLTKGEYSKLLKRSQEYSARPIQTADCWIADSRERASHWMRLRHESGHEGVGVEAWGTLEKERFASWRAGAPTAAIQLIHVVLEHGGLDDEMKAKVREVPTSTLMRVVQTPHAAKRLGIQYHRGTKLLRTLFPEAEIAKGFTRVLTDLVNGTINSRDINRAGDIRHYVDSFPKAALPKSSTRMPEARPVEVNVKSHATSSTVPTKPKGKRGTGGPRNFLVPREFKVRITQARLADIYRELRALPLDKYPNAIAVAFRVFTELTADHYIEARSLKTEQQLNSMSLREKLLCVAKELKDAGAITKQQHDAVRRAAQDQHLLAAGTKTFHAYVHNRHVVPQASELRAAWDQLQSFVEGAWA